MLGLVFSRGRRGGGGPLALGREPLGRGCDGSLSLASLRGGGAVHALFLRRVSQLGDDYIAPGLVGRSEREPADGGAEISAERRRHSLHQRAGADGHLHGERADEPAPGRGSASTLPRVGNVVPLWRLQRFVRTRESPRRKVVEHERRAGLDVVHGVVPELGGRAEERAFVALLLGGIVAEEDEETAGVGPIRGFGSVLLGHLSGRPRETLRFVSREQVRLGARGGGQVQLGGALGVLAGLTANRSRLFGDLLSPAVELSRLGLLLLSLALLLLLDGSLALGALASLANIVLSLALDLEVGDHRLDLLHDPSVFFLLSLGLRVGGCFRGGFGSLSLGLLLLLRSLARLLLFFVRLLLRRARREALSLGLFLLLLEPLSLFGFLHGFNLGVLRRLLPHTFPLLLQLGGSRALLLQPLLSLLLLLVRLVVRLVTK